MRVGPLLSLGSFAAAVAAGAAGSFVDRRSLDSTDGIYDKAGKVAEISARSLDNKLIRRDDFYGVGCDNDANGPVGFNPELKSAAVSSLKDYCSQYPAGCVDSIWAKSGDVVAFFCNWRNANFNGGSLDDAIGMVAAECANGNGGSYSDSEEVDRTYSYGVTNWERYGWCNVEAGNNT